MAENYNLRSKSARQGLDPRHTPYPFTIQKGLTLLFRRSPGTGAETWLCRYRVDGKNKTVKLRPVTKDYDFKEAVAEAQQKEKIGTGEVKGEEREASITISKKKYVTSTVSELVVAYIAYHAPLKANPGWEAESTKRANQVVFTHPIGKIRLAALDTPEILRHQRDLAAGWTNNNGKAFDPMKPASVNRACAVLRAALTWGYGQKLITHKPHDAAKRMKAGKAAKVKKFPMSEVARVVANAPDALKPIMTCMYYTGCRPVGARRLLVKHVDLKERQVTFISLKGDSGEATEYYTPLNDEATEFFRGQVEGKKPGDYVFTQANGKPWCDRNLAGRFATYRESAPLEGWSTLYIIRHSAITHMIKAGVPAPQAADDFGTSLEYISRNYYERDDDLSRRHFPTMELAS